MYKESLNQYLRELLLAKQRQRYMGKEGLDDKQPDRKLSKALFGLPSLKALETLHDMLMSCSKAGNISVKKPTATFEQNTVEPPIVQHQDMELPTEWCMNGPEHENEAKEESIAHLHKRRERQQQQIEAGDMDNDHNSKKNGGRPPIMSSINCLLMTLFILRCGVSFEIAALFFGIHPHHSAKIFAAYLRSLEIMFHDLTHGHQVENFLLPKGFPEYKKLQYIIDATELWCQAPYDKLRQRTMFSAYKHHCTVKFLVGITPSGVIAFVSEGYPGKISDAMLTYYCGFLDYIRAGYDVMADRGFTIWSMLQKLGASLIVPWKRMKKQKRLTPNQNKKQEKIANFRYIFWQAHDTTTKIKLLQTLITYIVPTFTDSIHVERAMAVIKHWKSIDQTQPLTSKDLWSSKFYVCAMLSNVGEPLVSNCE